MTCAGGMYIAGIFLPPPGSTHFKQKMMTLCCGSDISVDRRDYGVHLAGVEARAVGLDVDDAAARARDRSTDRQRRPLQAHPR